jgi:T5SS/PEP-CTERM-associated repeat protein
MNSSDLSVGERGMGTLDISDGAKVTSVAGVLGNHPNSTGVATVSDAGEWINTGNLSVGVIGNGSLSITGGGMVSNATADISQRAASTSTATVDGMGSVWSSSGGLAVGTRGNGTLTVLEGGLVSNVDGYVGSLQNATGKVTVDGHESRWTNTGDLFVGNLGHGTLNLRGGGTVSNREGRIGSAAGAIGIVTVDGADTLWQNSLRFFVGDNGLGYLEITDGGRVESMNSVVGGGQLSSRGYGEVLVEGPDSEWWTPGYVIVGDVGDGILQIRQGGRVTSAYGGIGQNSPATGFVSVSNPDSHWNNPGPLNIGYDGKGTLNVFHGASVTNTNSFIAARSLSQGTVTLSDPDAQWTMTGRLSIGGDAGTGLAGGDGRLTIQNSGAVNVALDTVLFPQGQLRLQGGILDTAAISFQGGGLFDWTSGTLHVDVFHGNLVNPGGILAPGTTTGDTIVMGNYTQQAAGTLEIEIGGTGMGSQYDFVNVMGSALLDGQLQLKLAGGFVPGPAHQFTVLTANSLAGFFDNAGNGQRVTTADGGGSFLVHYGAASAFNPNHIVLTAFQANDLPGDYNDNGVVDAADYVVWRNTLGDAGIGLPADGNGNNQIDPGDYTVWRMHFGQASGSGTAQLHVKPKLAAVPEPGTLVLWVVAMVLGSQLMLTYNRLRSDGAGLG